MADIENPENLSARLAFRRLRSISSDTPGFSETWLLFKKDIRSGIDGTRLLSEEEILSMLSQLALRQTLENVG